ncbi:hypothetical protein HPB50_023589 [Hyalomma asiaticum]|uniref:Uncharacterized protein n=1 Tax=Hyalomma asiaticum TaxID=266040 RepID=A0ACB7T4A2_HYAAI|nr:hypothetical protein HPB50_023589 [Hyalomma asiaticum]
MCCTSNAVVRSQRLRAGQRRLALEEATPPCGRGRPKLAVILRGGTARTLHYERSRYSRVSLSLAFLWVVLLHYTPQLLMVLAQVLVRKVPEDQQSIEIRVAVLGSVDVGKSTVLGVLTQGELDNGRGSARLNLFRHLHEIQTGHTSSISREILGFTSQGQPVTYGHCRSPEELCERSAKLITFIDLAGHQKYLRTTVFGLTGHSPHFVMLVVNAASGLNGTGRDHLLLALALQVKADTISKCFNRAGFLRNTEALEDEE